MKNQLNLMKTTFADKGYPVSSVNTALSAKHPMTVKTNITVHILPENCAS
jgi:hypothetical protein